jgi:hypothetical protein
MGRGLSDLQRWIVIEAAKRKVLSHADILMGYFGWKAERRVNRYGDEGFPIKNRWDHKGDLVHPGARYFSRAKIGEKEYANTRGTLTRSCNRLAERGLVKLLCGYYSPWAGVKITDKGRLWLSVNSEANLPQT